MELYIDNRQNKIKLDDSIIKAAQHAIKKTLLMEKGSLAYEISLVFTDNEEINKLNKKYRKIDSVTDVLSFPMEQEKIPLPVPILGDIVISIERAREQAAEYNHSLIREVSYLTVHSMLHLLGYDHIEYSDKLVMRRKEKEIMKELKIFKNRGQG